MIAPSCFEANSGDFPARQGTPEELSIVSSGYLPTILAQHLFTSFIWAITERLERSCLQGEDKSLDAVKVDPGVFSLDSFKESWHGVKITHSRLERFVEYAVTAGLGTRSEILLCMVPAFSFRDLLPNENVLSLMPSDPQRIQQHGWTRTASFYYSLLESDIGVAIEEYFAVAVVVETMEFIYMAFEPYTDDENVKIPPDPDLKYETGRLVGCLSERFQFILKKLLPVYACQRRRRIFQGIFRYCAEGNGGQEKTERGSARMDDDSSSDDSSSDVSSSDDSSSDDPSDTDDLGVAAHAKSLGTYVQEFCEWQRRIPYEAQTPEQQRDLDAFFTRIGFTEDHQAWSGHFRRRVGKAKNSRSFYSPRNLPWLIIYLSHVVKAVDIFGWTILHYVATSLASPRARRLKALMREAATVSPPIHQWRDKLKRSLIHIAALNGGVQSLEVMINALRAQKVEVAAVLRLGGIDGMTPIHLAAKSESVESVRCLLWHQKGFGLDIWGRSPIHLAVIAQTAVSADEMKLLAGDSRPDHADIFGRTPLNYLVAMKGIGPPDEIFQEVAKEYLELWKNSGAKDDDNKTLFHYAVELQLRETEMKDVLSKGASINAVDNNGTTPLHLAVSTGQEWVVELLLEHGADPSVTNSDGTTLLMLACETGQLGSALLLLDAINSIDETANLTELTSGAVVEDKPQELEKSLNSLNEQYVLDHLTAPGEEYKSAAQCNAASNLPQELVKQRGRSIGGSIDAQDREGLTALYRAIKAGKAKVAIYLLENGANPVIKDQEGRISLHHVSLTRGLTGDDMESLFNATLDAWNRRANPLPMSGTKRTSFCSQDGGDGLDTPESSLVTANADTHCGTSRPGDQIYAGQEEHFEPGIPHPAAKEDGDIHPNQVFVKDIIDFSDNNEQTALHLAVEAGNDTTAGFLMSRGANPGIVDEKGLTPFHIAADNGCCPKFMERVLRNCDPGIINLGVGESGESAILLACKNRRVEAIKMLVVNEKVNLNCQATRYFNFTPFHFAVTYKNLDIIRLLLDSPHADPSRRLLDSAGRNPLQYALQVSSDKCVTELLLHTRTQLAEQVDGIRMLCDLNKIGLAVTILRFFSENSRFEERLKGLSDIWPLHLLARQGDADTIRAFVGAGIDASATDGDGWTALDVARRYGHDHLQTNLADVVSAMPPTESPLTPISLELLPGNDVKRVNCSIHSESHEGVIGIYTELLVIPRGHS